MEPTNDGEKDKQDWFTWERIRSEGKKFYKRHDEAIQCIVVGCIVEAVMIRRAIHQTEARVRDDLRIVSVDMIENDRDGRDRIYIDLNNGNTRTFSKVHEPESLMDQAFGKQK